LKIISACGKIFINKIKKEFFSKIEVRKHKIFAIIKIKKKKTKNSKSFA